MAASESSRRSLASRVGVALYIAVLSAISLGTSAVADEPVPILTESATHLRANVRAVFEQDKPLNPETVASLKESALPHPVSPPNYGRFSQPVWGYVAIVNRLARREWILSYTLPTVEDVQIFVREAG